jgi:hypothetical protein
MTYDHLLKIDKNNRQIHIFRVFQDGSSVLFTSLDLPAAQLGGWSDETVKLALRLGEDLLIDSPVARTFLNL